MHQDGMSSTRRINRVQCSARTLGIDVIATTGCQLRPPHQNPQVVGALLLQIAPMEGCRSSRPDVGVVGAGAGPQLICRKKTHLISWDNGDRYLKVRRILTAGMTGTAINDAWGELNYGQCHLITDGRRLLVKIAVWREPVMSAQDVQVTWYDQNGHEFIVAVKKPRYSRP